MTLSAVHDLFPARPPPHQLLPAMSDVKDGETAAAKLAQLAREFREVPRMACFKSSIYWGLGLGVLFGVHRFKQGGVFVK